MLAAAAAALSGGGQGGPARVAVDTARPGAPCPRSFLGLSMEWTSVAPFGGAARPGDRRAAAAVEAAAGAPLPLRVGGASADEAWWNPATAARGPRRAPRHRRGHALRAWPASPAASTRP